MREEGRKEGRLKGEKVKRVGYIMGIPLLSDTL